MSSSSDGFAFALVSVVGADTPFTTGFDKSIVAKMEKERVTS